MNKKEIKPIELELIEDEVIKKEEDSMEHITTFASYDPVDGFIFNYNEKKDHFTIYQDDDHAGDSCIFLTIKELITLSKGIIEAIESYEANK